MAFSDWTEKKKLVFSIAVGGFFVVFAWGLFFWRLSILSDKTEILNQKKEEFNKVAKEVESGNMDKLKTDLDEYRKLFDEVKDSVPLEREVVTFITEDLRRLIEEKTNLGKNEIRIKEGDVSDVQLPSVKGTSSVRFKKQAFSLEVTGTLDDAILFLNIIEERMPSIINVDRIGITVAQSTKKTDEATLLKMSFDFFIYFKEDVFKTAVVPGKPAAPGVK
ncbi:MAG: hypothetical protein ABIH86_00530 [Planctomycetota bacterium]